MKARLLAFIGFLLLASLTGLAASRKDTHSPDSLVEMRFRIFYPVNQTDIHEDYMDNADMLHRIRMYLEKSPQIGRITIYSYASPEGSYAANKRLSAERGKKAKEFILSQIPAERHLPDSLIVLDPTAENWSGLRDLVYYQCERDDKDEILAILDRTDITDERRKVLLKRLNWGRPWNYILSELMPQLRYATWISIWERIEVDKVIEEPENLDMEMPDLSMHKLPMPELELAPVIPVVEEDTLGPWAIKTNLIYDALLSPSVEVEYRMSPRWSVQLDYSIAWWKNTKKHQYYQIHQFSPEVRYWLKPERGWHGHYVGAFVGAGYYDLENGGRGYKGEFLMGGFSYGYMFPIGRSLSLDAGIGVGYMHTKYEEYLPIEGHYVYQQTSRTGYIGPLKAKLSLVWHLRSNKKGGAR